MIEGLFISASGMLPKATQQESIANNLANAEVPGFKKDKLISQDKGQNNCSKAFVSAIHSGIESPINFDEIMEVARFSINIAESLRK